MIQVGPSKYKTLKFVLLIFLIILGWYLGNRYNIQIEDIRSKLDRFPVGVSGLIFVVLYVGLTSIFWFGPKDVLRVSSALLFGGYVSTIFVWIAEVLNSLVMFHVSRWLGRDFVEQRMQMKTDRLKQVSQSRSFIGVISWRINPIVPIRFTDLGYGLTNMRFVRYVIPASIATIPRIFWQQYIFADIGTLFISQDVEKILSYFQTNVFTIRLTLGYFLLVMICVILAGIKQVRKHK